jgi:hypothetical protein
MPLIYQTIEQAIDIHKDFLHEIISAFIAEEMDDEELKLKLFNAISSPENENMNFE